MSIDQITKIEKFEDFKMTNLQNQKFTYTYQVNRILKFKFKKYTESKRLTRLKIYLVLKDSKIEKMCKIHKITSIQNLRIFHKNSKF